MLMIALRKSYVFLTSLRQGDDKCHRFVGAAGGDTAAVGLDNLLGDGQAQARAAGIAAPGGVQAEELAEDPRQLLFRDRCAPVLHQDTDTADIPGEADGDLRARIAVVDGIAEEIVENSLQLIRVAVERHIRRKL